jgi:hypothetical protein
MKCLIFALGVIGAGLCSHAALAVTPAECFARPAAVFVAHPSATHASYSLRAKRAKRCWYADAFNTEAKIKAKSAPPAVATVAETSAPGAAITAPQPRITAATPASPQAIMQFPGKGQPAVQISVNTEELRGPLPADETTDDFESRFSASKQETPK